MWLRIKHGYTNINLAYMMYIEAKSNVKEFMYYVNKDGKTYTLFSHITMYCQFRTS